VFKQNALAFTAFADNGRNLALENLQIDAIKNRSISKPFGDIFKLD
jgi:hypothetical protein